MWVCVGVRGGRGERLGREEDGMGVDVGGGQGACDAAFCRQDAGSQGS